MMPIKVRKQIYLEHTSSIPQCVISSNETLCSPLYFVRSTSFTNPRGMRAFKFCDKILVFTLQMKHFGTNHKRPISSRHFGTNLLYCWCLEFLALLVVFLTLEPQNPKETNRKFPHSFFGPFGGGGTDTN